MAFSCSPRCRPVYCGSPNATCIIRHAASRAATSSGSIIESKNVAIGEHVLGPIAFENGWSGDHIVQLVAEGGEIHATVRITLK